MKKTNNKRTKAVLKLASTSIVAASLTSGLFTVPAPVRAVELTQATVSPNLLPPVYTGDSLLHFQSLLTNIQLQQNSVQGESGGLVKPVADSFNHVSVYRNVPLFGKLHYLSDSEAAADQLTYEILPDLNRDSSKGTIELLNEQTGTYKFTPGANYVGNFQFEYVVILHDSQSGTELRSDPAAVNLDIAAAADQLALDGDIEALTISFAPGDSISSIKSNLTLPSAGLSGSVIRWTSSRMSVLSDRGAVSRRSSDMPVTLTASLTKGDFTATKNFNLIVTGDSSSDDSNSSKKESSIEQFKKHLSIKASNHTNETPDSAAMEWEQAKDGKQTAKIKLLSDGIRSAALAAKAADTITIRVPDLKGVDSLQADIPSGALNALKLKQATLQIETADAGISLPTSLLNIDTAARSLGVPADKVEMQVELKRAPALQNLKLASLTQAYTVSITAMADGKRTDLSEFESRYASVRIPMEKPATPGSRAAGVIIEDGKAYPVPVTFSADGTAQIHSTRTGTFQIVEQAVSFPDLKEHPAKEAVETLAGKLVINEAEDGAFHPDAQVTRAEFAAYITRALGLEAAAASGSSPFKDVAPGAKYAGAVQSAVAAGIFKGIAEQEFAPDSPMTREQIAAVLVRAANRYATGLQGSVNAGTPVEALKQQGVSDWALEEASAANRMGLFTISTSNLDRAETQGTRSESAVVILDLLRRAGLSD